MLINWLYCYYDNKDSTFITQTCSICNLCFTKSLVTRKRLCVSEFVRKLHLCTYLFWNDKGIFIYFVVDPVYFVWLHSYLYSSITNISLENSPQYPASVRTPVEVASVQRPPGIIDVPLSSCLTQRAIQLELEDPCHEIPVKYERKRN